MDGYASQKVGDLKVVELFVILLIIWVLVDIWVVFFKNLYVSTLRLDPNSTLHSFAFAFAVTTILLAFIILAGSTLQEALVNTGVVPIPTQQTDQNNNDIGDGNNKGDCYICKYCKYSCFSCKRKYRKKKKKVI